MGRVILLIVSIALLAATASAVKWMQIHQPLMVDTEAISFCNVLFVGNFLAGLVALGSFGPRRIGTQLREANRRTLALLVLNGALALFIPALIFAALRTTTVTNAVLLGRFESVAYALLAALVLRQRLGRAQQIGYGVISLGVLALVVTQTDGGLMRGELFILTAALLQGIAAILSRSTLQSCGLGLFVFSRNLISSLAFLVVGIQLYGAEHFMHAFGPRLWLVMLIYSVLLVVVAQLLWYRSLGSLPPSTVAGWSLTAPAMGIFFAWLLLGEVPTAAQWAGAGIILLGMLVTRLGPRMGATESTVLMAEKSLSGA